MYDPNKNNHIPPGIPMDERLAGMNDALKLVREELEAGLDAGETLISPCSLALSCAMDRIHAAMYQRWMTRKAPPDASTSEAPAPPRIDQISHGNCSTDGDVLQRTNCPQETE